MATFKRDDQVRLIQPVIQGTIVERVIVDDVDNYRVQWTDAEGQQQERLFTEDQLEAVAV
jgi:hypothetical protein